MQYAENDTQKCPKTRRLRFYTAEVKLELQRKEKNHRVLLFVVFHLVMLKQVYSSLILLHVETVTFRIVGTTMLHWMKCYNIGRLVLLMMRMFWLNRDWTTWLVVELLSLMFLVLLLFPLNQIHFLLFLKVYPAWFFPTDQPCLCHSIVIPVSCLIFN